MFNLRYGSNRPRSPFTALFINDVKHYLIQSFSDTQLFQHGIIRNLSINHNGRNLFLVAFDGCRWRLCKAHSKQWAMTSHCWLLLLPFCTRGNGIRLQTTFVGKLIVASNSQWSIESIGTIVSGSLKYEGGK